MLTVALVHKNRAYLRSKEWQTLTALLVEAIQPLNEAFGSTWYYVLEPILRGTEAPLKVTLHLPATFEGDPEEALRKFDQSWWVHNCHRSGANLVFDYLVESPRG